MELALIIKAIIMGIVEGITEFLPISSTGHLILTGELLGFLQKDKRDVFEVFIQLGAMLAVVWEYRVKIRNTMVAATHPGPQRRLCLGIVLAFVPAAVAGLLLGHTIKAYLFAPVPVAAAFIVGGVLILWAERRRHHVSVATVDDLTLGKAAGVGVLQCLALIPGTSRSGATIIGGLFLGLSRKAATEFSFFLGIPTLGAAALYSLFKARHQLSMDEAGLFAVGFVAAFASAFIAIRALLRFITNHTFVAFAWYRIAFGLLVLGTAWGGMVDWTA